MSDFTYAEVGASRQRSAPAGYNVLRHRVRLGGQHEIDFMAAADAVLTMAVHRAAGVRMKTSTPRAAPGTLVTAGIGVGRLRIVAPCEVVWAVEEPDLAGFGYGTLAGHPERGEECFVVERVGDDVYFEVFAFSRAAAWYTKMTSPIVVLLQHSYARLLGVALRRLSRRRTA